MDLKLGDRLADTTSNWEVIGLPRATGRELGATAPGRNPHTPRPARVIEDFVRDHRRHGSLIADATEPAWNGYLLQVACSCVVFERWVTPPKLDWTCSARRR